MGATVASIHALVYRQLVEEPIGLASTREKPQVDAVANVGGSNQTTVTVHRRIRQQRVLESTPVAWSYEMTLVVIVHRRDRHLRSDIPEY